MTTLKMKLQLKKRFLTKKRRSFREFTVLLYKNFKKYDFMDNNEKNKMLPIKLKQLRVASGLPQRKVAAALDIDTATYSKIETGKFIPSKEQILQIAKILSANESELLEMWMAEKIVAIAENDMDLAPAAIKLVGEKLNIDKEI